MERGFSDESIQNFHLGYSDSWVELYNYLKWKWYDDTLISDSKIFIDVSRKKDKFINRIIFPIQNARWDIVAFTGRIIGQWEPKYLNSPASDYYDKSWILYGLYTARHAITKLDYVIITEWNPDAIAMQQYDFTNTVAVSGTALTEKQLTILKRLTHRIYLCFDNDKAWDNATKLSLENMKNKGFEVKIISLSWWKDPDEILKSWADFQPYIDKALTPIWYYIEKATFDPNNLDEKKKLLTQLLDIVKSYSDNIERDFYLKEISKLLDISDKIIYDMFNRTRIQKPKDSEKNTWNNRAITSEDLAIWYIINDNDYLSLIQDKIIFKDNIGKDLHNIIDKWLVYLDSIPLGEKERYKWVALKVEMENKQHTEENSEEKLAKLIFWINREIYKNQVESLKNKISSWDANALKEYSELIKLAKSHWIK
jgi:DNA primase